MIRYVVAVILGVAIIGISMTAAEHVGHQQSDRDVQQEIADLEAEAVELYQQEELPPAGHPGPQRTITLELPADSTTSEPIQHFQIRPGADNTTVVEYSIAGGPTSQEVIHVPVRIAGSTSALEFRGPGRPELLLTLERDANGDPIVEIGHRR